jgi:hypothetical protein
MKVDLNEIDESVFKMQTKTISLKFREAALMFLETGVYERDSSNLLKHTDALLYKFTLSVVNLEFYGGYLRNN